MIAGSLFTALAFLLAFRAADWSFTGLWLTPDQQAQRSYDDEDYVGAAEQFTELQRQGTAWYRATDYEQAASAFARGTTAADAYNRGTALVLLGQYDAAIDAFDAALEQEPGWKEAEENRAIAVIRRDRLKPPDDAEPNTEQGIGADEIVFDDRANKSSQQETVEVGEGDQLSETELRELWLRRVQTRPADFLRAKFAYQQSQSGNEGNP